MGIGCRMAQLAPLVALFGGLPRSMKTFQHPRSHDHASRVENVTLKQDAVGHTLVWGGPFYPTY